VGGALLLIACGVSSSLYRGGGGDEGRTGGSCVVCAGA
jgi:hypothetical protein